VAMHATPSWISETARGAGQLQCTACRRVVSLDDVTGDEPYLPEYRHASVGGD
jgi:hypothetical protein